MPGVKAYKLKLKTNPAFEQACVFTLDTCRELYNASLQERRDAYQINHVSLNYNSQSAQLPGIKASARTLPPSTVRCFKTFCADLRRRSTTSFAASRQVKEPGYPRFKGKAFFDSFVYPQSGFRLEGDKLHLSKIGFLACPSIPSD
ncbi:MAG: helix-turn-helix domain-containing protein [Acidobacteria bacterium]|nr:helix-turn-helix domain-containing protein [Acidobacteriota bacterium]